MGPLDGTKVVEMAGLGPVPFCAMMPADMGADVVRIEGPNRNTEDPHDRQGPIWRGRSSVSLDLKDPADLAHAKEILARADVVPMHRMQRVRPSDAPVGRPDRGPAEGRVASLCRCKFARGSGSRGSV